MPFKQLQSTKDKALKRVSDWIEKYASSGAKETLIKSVLQALPVYAMGIFKFPASLCEELSHIIRNFWCGDEDERRKTHWLAWDKLTRPKGEGGMGFRDLHLFNLALLGKHGWRFLRNPTSLCARVMKGRYFPDSDFMQASAPKAASATWRVIIAGREALLA